MASFYLEILGFTSKKRMALLTITAANGTNEDGFGWEWFGAGFNTGGKWIWLPPNPVIDVTGWSITLRDKDGTFFGFVDADWDPLPTPTGFPPEPWFSETGINKGKVTVVIINPGGQKASWRLRNTTNL